MKYSKETITKKIEELLDKKYHNNDQIEIIPFVVKFLENLDLSSADKKMLDLFRSMVQLSDLLSTMGQDGIEQLKSFAPDTFPKEGIESFLKNMFEVPKSKDESEPDNLKKDDNKIN